MSTIKTNNVVDLAGNVLLAKGQAAKYVNSLQDLLAANMESHKVVNVLNYHTGLEGGGGVFYWDASKPKTEHNGGTVIDPTAVFPTDWNNQTQLATWFDTANAGTGCWVRQFDGAVNVKWFGAYANGIMDDTLSFKTAVATAEVTGGELHTPVGDVRLTAPILITRPISIIGSYPHPYEGSIGTRGKGSWLFFDHLGEGLTIAGSLVMGTVFLDKFGTYRTQPAPVAGWTPTNYDFDITFNNTDLVIGDIMLYNPTRGVKGRNGNAGRLTIGRLRGQPLVTGIDLDQQFDVPSIGHVHFWPFWKDDTNVHAYTLNNLDALYFKRADNPVITSIFTIFARAGVRIGQSLDGTTNKLRVGNADFDRGKFGVWIDNTSTAGTRVQFGNLTVQGESGITGTKGYFVEGNNSVCQVANMEIRNSDQNAVRLAGSNNSLRVGLLTVVGYNLGGAGFPSVESAANNTVEISGKPEITNGGGTAGKYGGAGLIYVDEWRSYAPTITPSSGTITTLGAVSGKYKLRPYSVDISLEITITTNGTGAGAITSTLPFNTDSLSYSVPGRETATGGATLLGTVSGSSLRIQKYDNTYPAVDGAKLVMTGSYGIS